MNRFPDFVVPQQTDAVSLQFCVPPCPVCGRIIKDDDKAVQCYKKCKRWFHKECINLRFSVYVRSGEKITLRWSCERRECRTSSGDDDVEDWTAMEGVELLLPEKDRVLVLPENNFYKARVQDDEISPSVLPSEEKKEDIRPQKLRLAPDKELLASLTSTKYTPSTNRQFTNELLDTYNKRLKDRQKKDKKRKEGFRMETIKSFFRKSDKAEGETSKSRVKKSKSKLAFEDKKKP